MQDVFYFCLFWSLVSYICYAREQLWGIQAIAGKTLEHRFLELRCIDFVSWRKGFAYDLIQNSWIKLFTCKILCRPESEPLSLLERCRLAKGAVNGLMYLHRRNVIHFDIKPDNFLLEYPLSPGHLPKIKIADFGLALYKTEGLGIPDAGMR